MSESQAETVLHLLVTGRLEGYPQTWRSLQRMDAIHTEHPDGRPRLIEVGEHLGATLLAFHALILLLERYARRHGREPMLGQGGFEAEFLAWLGGFSGDRVAIATFGDAPHPWRQLCLLVADVWRVRNRVQIEELIRQRTSEPEA